MEMGSRLSEDSGVAGDGEREPVAVADDEDMLGGRQHFVDERMMLLVHISTEGCRSMDRLRPDPVCADLKSQEVERSNQIIGKLFYPILYATEKVERPYNSTTSMKRVAEKQLSKDDNSDQDGDMDMGTDGFKKADEAVLATRRSVAVSVFI
jgi:hypothetical protein